MKIPNIKSHRTWNAESVKKACIDNCLYTEGSADAPVAFIVSEYGWTDWHSPDVRFYDGEFYSQKKAWNYDGKTEPANVDELPEYIRCRYGCWDNMSFEEALVCFEKAASEYLLIDGTIYERIGEPRYEIVMLGWEWNNGGTWMLVKTYYSDNDCHENVFSALDVDRAIAYANSVAASRGDTDNIGKFEKTIEVLMPEVVSIKSTE